MMVIINLLVFLVILDLLLCHRVIVSAESQQVDKEISIYTQFGTLVGNREKDTCDEWLGIPFAKPPIGKLRFADPVAWDEPFRNGVWDATTPGSFCPQQTGGDENCLFLNIWRPNNNQTATSLLPVMVFIHGGSFTSGSSLNEAPGLLPARYGEYRGCNLAQEQSIIVASMNYRLGPFGFAAFPEEGGEGRAANFGLKDQREALRWLQKHLASFGGNSNKITLFGESAGAMSVLVHLTSRKSRGLFRAAISESGYPIALSWDQGLNITDEFVKRAGCHGKESMRACLREKNTKQLVQAAGGSINPLKFLVQTGWNPVVDGSDLLEHPLKLLRSGPPHARRSHRNAPLLAGTNTNEGNLFVYMNHLVGMLPHQYKPWIQSFVNNHNVEQRLNASEIKQVVYLYKDEGDRRQRASTIATDGSFLCGTEMGAQLYSTRADTFVYRFNHRPACQAMMKNVLPGVYHTLELLFLFDNPGDVFCKFTEEDKSVGVRLRTMWANFAKKLNPSLGVGNGTAASFPKYTKNTRKTLVIQGTGDVIGENNRSEFCNFWQIAIFDKFLVAKMGPLSKDSNKRTEQR